MPEVSHQQSRLTTSSSLIAELKDFSPERWQDFVLIYTPLIRFWIREDKVTGPAVDDVLQECLKSIVTGIGHFSRDGLQGTFRGWLRTIAKRRSADHFRRLAPEQAVKQEILEHLPERPQKDASDLEAETQALHELQARALELVRQTTTEKTWQMFWQSSVEGIPTSEVASSFGVSQAAVRVARARVLKRLKELMIEPL